MKKQFEWAKGCVSLPRRGGHELVWRAHLAWVVAMGQLVAAVPALASGGGVGMSTPTLGDIGTNAGDQSTGLTSGALRLAAFAGIVCMIIAFLKGRNARQQGEGVGSYITLGIVGALLFAIPTIISVVNTSLIGSDASSSMQGEIIK